MAETSADIAQAFQEANAKNPPLPAPPDTADNSFSIDILKVYYGEPITLDCGITLRQPTIQEIRDFGEMDFWKTAVTLCSNPTSYRVILWDEGIDWNKVNDFEFFYTLSSDLSDQDVSLIFPDLQWSKFRPVLNSEQKLTLVYLDNPDIQIDEESYKELVAYLRIFFGIHPKTEKAKGRGTKELIIMDEKNRIAMDKRNGRENVFSQSTLFSLISSAVNQPGFKYGIQECLSLTIFQFMDAIKRQSAIQSANSMMTGMYSGMIDIKKGNLEKELDWTRNLYE